MVVYLITNLVNGKYYVGQHKHANLAKYIANCFARALRGKEDKPLLYRAVRKYGLAAFICETLATAASEEQLDALERLWIAALAARNLESGYNIAHGGEGGYGKGLPEHYRAQHSLRMAGDKNPSFGKPFPAAEGSGTEAAQRWMKEHPEEHRANCSAASKASWESLTDEQRAARLAPAQAARWANSVDRTWSDERRAKGVLAATGSKNGFFGKHHTPETIAKANAARAAKRLARKEALSG